MKRATNRSRRYHFRQVITYLIQKHCRAKKNADLMNGVLMQSLFKSTTSKSACMENFTHSTLQLKASTQTCYTTTHKQQHITQV